MPPKNDLLSNFFFAILKTMAQWNFFFITWWLINHTVKGHCKCRLEGLRWDETHLLYLILEKKKNIWNSQQSNTSTASCKTPTDCTEKIQYIFSCYNFFTLHLIQHKFWTSIEQLYFLLNVARHAHHCFCHSRPQRPCSFWSSPRIATSGQVQHRKSTIHRLPLTLCMLGVKSGKSDWSWSQFIVFAKSFKTGMLLDLARGRNSWCWPKGARYFVCNISAETRPKVTVCTQYLAELIFWNFIQ